MILTTRARTRKEKKKMILEYELRCACEKNTTIEDRSYEENLKYYLKCMNKLNNFQFKLVNFQLFT